MSRVEPQRNVYIGHRYVPLLVGEWDNSNEYEGLSIVTHKGASYTSKKRTPPGIDIENEEYWILTGNYNAQVEYYRDDVKSYRDEVYDYKSEVNQSFESHKSEMTQSLETHKNENNAKWESTEKKIYSRTINLAEKGVTKGDDATNEFLEAYNELGAGGTIFIPEDITISQDIVLDKLISIEGTGRGNNAGHYGVTITLDGCSFTLSETGSKITGLNFYGNGRTGKGLIIRNGAINLTDVAVKDMEGHGIIIGDGTNYINANGVGLTNVRSTGNGGDGIYLISKNGEIPNTNTTRMYGVTASRNDGNGITFNNTMDGKMISIAAEENKGYGVHLKNGSGGHLFLSPYIEWNGENQDEFYADDTCVRNMIFGNRRDSVIQHFVFDNPQNFMMGNDNLLGLFPLFEQMATREFKISNPNPGGAPNNGYWMFKMDSETRELNVGIKGSAESNFVLNNRAEFNKQIQLSDEGIRSKTGKAIRDFTIISDIREELTITANNFNYIRKNIPGFDESCTYAINSNVPYGIIASGRVEDGVFNFIYHNVTDEPITMDVESRATVFKVVHS